MKYLFLLVAWLGISVAVYGQSGTWDAATCNLHDVNACVVSDPGGSCYNHVTDPGHTTPLHRNAVDGDTVNIPGGTCTWTTAQIFPTASGNAVRTNLIGVQFIGACTNFVPTSSTTTGCTTTTLNDSLSGSAMFGMTIQCISTGCNSLTRVSGINIVPTLPQTGYSIPIFFGGICDSVKGCPPFRMDHITIPNNWGGANGMFTFCEAQNVWGVIDHNMTVAGGAGPTNNGIELCNPNAGNYQNSGIWGDNSWAQPDTFGTVGAVAGLPVGIYLEDNYIYATGILTDTEYVDPNTGHAGGGRWTCRFNDMLATAGTGGCTDHGTDTLGRQRGGRQLEAYGNTVICTNTNANGGCGAAFSGRSTVEYVFGNTVSATQVANMGLASQDAQRRWRPVVNFGPCDGSSPWDTNDGVVYYTGTIQSIAAGTGNHYTITDTGAPGWTAGTTFVTSAPNGGTGGSGTGASYSFHDTTRVLGYEIASANGTNSIDVNANGGFCNAPPGCTPPDGFPNPQVGDTYQILRATVCLDQPNRGQGLLVHDSNVSITSISQSGGGNPVAVIPSAGNMRPYSSMTVSGTSVGAYNNHTYTVLSIAGTNVTFNGPAGGNATGGTAGIQTLVSTGQQGAVSEALDPSYAWANTIGTGAVGGIGSQTSTILSSTTGGATPAHSADIYQESTNQTAQTNSTHPFNGNVGVGYGTISNRPNTCTQGTGYASNNEGSWNHAPNATYLGFGFPNYELYICGAGGWPTAGSPNYVPAPYPHTLITASSVMVLSPTSQNFGSIQVGNSSAPVTFTVSNNSANTAGSIVLSLTGGNPGDFSTTNSGAGSCAALSGGNLASGASCTFTATFSPTATGARSTTLHVAYSGGDGSSPLSAALSGTGTGTPLVQLTPNSIIFPNTAIGATSAIYAITLKNIGPIIMTISSIAITGVGFSQTNTCGGTLAANATCQVNVVFQPTAFLSFGASLIFTTNAPSSPDTVPLSGVAISVAETPASLGMQ